MNAFTDEVCILVILCMFASALSDALIVNIAKRQALRMFMIVCRLWCVFAMVFVKFEPNRDEEKTGELEKLESAQSYSAFQEEVIGLSM